MTDDTRKAWLIFLKALAAELLKYGSSSLLEEPDANLNISAAISRDQPQGITP